MCGIKAEIEPRGMNGCDEERKEIEEGRCGVEVLFAMEGICNEIYLELRPHPEFGQTMSKLNSLLAWHYDAPLFGRWDLITRPLVP
jgi:hypothetical protein